MTVDWTELASQLDGHAHLNTPGNVQIPPSWNALLKTSTPVLNPEVPSCIVECRSSQDVVKAVNFAIKYRLRISAKGTGHHYGGASFREGCVLLDMSRMKDISVDPVKRVARIQPGVTAAQIKAATIPHGLHFTVGHLSEVGCSGYILGGGHGWGSQKWGAACDNVLAFQVVTPSRGDTSASCATGAAQECGAEARWVTHDNDPELFQCLKGAGEEVKERLCIGSGNSFSLWEFILPGSVTAEGDVRENGVTPPCWCSVAECHQSLQPMVPACMELCMSFTHDTTTSPTQPTIILSAMALTAPHGPERDTEVKAVEAVFGQIRGLMPDQRLALYDGTVPYHEALSVLDPSWNWPGLCLYGHAMFMNKDAFTPQLMKELGTACTEMTAPRSIILICPTACSSQLPSALDFRDTYLLNVYAMWPRTEAGPEADGDKQHVRWVERVVEAGQGSSAGLYINEVMQNQPGQLLKCFKPETVQLIHKVQGRIDPLGLLRKLQ